MKVDKHYLEVMLYAVILQCPKLIAQWLTDVWLLMFITTCPTVHQSES